MRILFIGDIVGRPGVKLVQDALRELGGDRLQLVFARTVGLWRSAHCVAEFFGCEEAVKMELVGKRREQCVGFRLAAERGKRPGFPVTPLWPAVFLR